MALQLTTPPAVEPVLLGDLKEFMAIDDEDSSKDSILTGLNKAARNWCEVYTQRRFITQTWTLWMDFFPGYIDTKLAGTKVSSPFVSGSNAVLVGIRYAIALPYPPALSIVNFTYLNANGQTTNMSIGPVAIAALTNTAEEPLVINTAAANLLQTGSSVTIAGNAALLSFLGGTASQVITVLSETSFALDGTVGDGTTAFPAQGTVQGFNYVADLQSQPARLTPIFGQMWPVARVVPNAVMVQYQCGYGPTGASVPPEIQVAIKMLASHWFENRAPSDKDVPMAVKAILGPYRDLRF